MLTGMMKDPLAFGSRKSHAADEAPDIAVLLSPRTARSVAFAAIPCSLRCRANCSRQARSVALRIVSRSPCSLTAFTTTCTCGCGSSVCNTCNYRGSFCSEHNRLAYRRAQPQRATISGSMQRATAPACCYAFARSFSVWSGAASLPSARLSEIRE